MRMAWVAIFFVAVCVAGLMHGPALAAGKGHTIVFVVDTSERVDPYLTDIKAAIVATADGAKKGDTLGIISFSDSVTRLVSKKISNPRDTQSVTGRLDAIEAEGEIGDVAAGIARALDELGQLERRGDKNRKGIIVISASQSPDENKPLETLETALRESSQHLTRDEWYIQYCHLNGIIDKAVEDFVKSNRGLSFDISALAAKGDLEPAIALVQIFTAPIKLDPPRIIDLSGAILGKDEEREEWVPLGAGSEISENMRLRVASNSRVIISLDGLGRLGLAPETHLTLNQARKHALTDTRRFLMELEAGSIWMNLNPKSPSTYELAVADAVFEPAGKTATIKYYAEVGELELTSFSDAFSAKLTGKNEEMLQLQNGQSVRILNGQPAAAASAAESHLIEKWKSWKRALVDNAPLSILNFTVPEIIFPEESISLGPIKAKEVQNREFTLQVAGVKDISKLKIGVDISLELPDGLNVTSGVIDGDIPDQKILSLQLDGSNGFQSQRSETHKGMLRLMPAPESKVLFEKIVVPLTLTTEGPLLPASVLFAALGAILLVVIAVGAGRFMRAKSRLISRPHGVIGRLIVVNDPTGGRVGTINLEELSTKSSRLSLVVGRDRAAEVRLRHASVSAAHCTLEAYLVGGRLETYIEQVDSSRVTVNGDNIRSKTRLSDGCKIEIGEFIYHFEDTQIYKKVEVVRRNGRRISGILDTAGMDADGFRLSPMDAVSPSERARVKFSDIRYATFYRRVVDILSDAPRPIPKPDTMKRVELMFKKGNTISGYIQREYVEGRRRYVELLPLETGSDVDYTVVDYSAVVEKKFL
jgi:hypothetical protein